MEESSMNSTRKSVNTKTGDKQPVKQLEVDALKHQIQKLRWMGMDREAETACARLSRIAPGAVTDTHPG
jgi:hypothetical protein